MSQRFEGDRDSRVKCVLNAFEHLKHNSDLQKVAEACADNPRLFVDLNMLLMTVGLKMTPNDPDLHINMLVGAAAIALQSRDEVDA